MPWQLGYSVMSILSFPLEGEITPGTVSAGLLIGPIAGMCHG
jgi:hypothetical protein